MHHHSIHCFLPPHILDKLANPNDPVSMDNIRTSAASRATREAFSNFPMMAAIPSPTGQLHRLVYDMQNSPLASRLPGRLVRSEGEGPVQGDDAVNEAYDFSGDTYEFYLKVMNRNSLDNRGMALISSVHFHRNYNNAFWNGEQMTYGDGDGKMFLRFSKALDVVAHELTHGVVQHTCNLEYADEPGALNESFADVMSACVKQWKLKQDVTQADWLVGNDVLVPSFGIQALRTFHSGQAYANHPVLGTDPQPKHMSAKYTGTEDEGGVHINSGIPNHAFYLVATKLGGYAWERAGKIWYRTMNNLTRYANFQDAANMTYQVALADYGSQSAEASAVKDAWKQVGV